ncbi:MAG: KilA-N domain-containing protein [bacterium]|nr:MAG: KilA-N domain-containing protein [bacterium]
MKRQTKIIVKNISISFSQISNEDYISLTDIARYKNRTEPKSVVQNWMRNYNTIEFLGIWERLNNSNFKGVEFDAFKNMSGSNSFTLSPQKWIFKTNAIGIKSKSGKYGGGTYAHKDIAFEFASWISSEFRFYLIKEFQRLKTIENEKIISGWNTKRILAKVNYKIHTDAIKKHIIPVKLSNKIASIIYANEADVLNIALFGITAQDWRTKNPNKEGNIRDYSTVEQLVVISNLESINAELIRSGLNQKERLIKLNEIAIIQLKSLLNNQTLRKLDQKKV